MNKEILSVQNLSKSYGNKNFSSQVLKGVSLKVMENDFIAIMGPSGSGKTTLLNIISTIDKPSGGKVLLEEKDITKLNAKDLSKIRQNKIGFIFQDYNLLDTMSLKDNIALPLTLNGHKSKDVIKKINTYAALFGLSSHLEKYPYQLSGGQKQRGAAIRALITNPSILFADEPTGALDSKSGKDLLNALQEANRKLHTAIVMVTHDAFAASYAKDVYFLKDGQILCRLSAGTDRKKFYDKIMETQAALESRQI